MVGVNYDASSHSREAFAADVVITRDRLSTITNTAINTRLRANAPYRIRANPDAKRNERQKCAMHTRPKRNHSPGVSAPQRAGGKQSPNQYSFHDKERMAMPAIAIATPPI